MCQVMNCFPCCNFIIFNFQHHQILKIVFSHLRLVLLKWVTHLHRVMSNVSLAWQVLLQLICRSIFFNRKSEKEEDILYTCCTFEDIAIYNQPTDLDYTHWFIW